MVPCRSHTHAHAVPHRAPARPPPRRLFLENKPSSRHTDVQSPEKKMVPARECQRLKYKREREFEYQNCPLSHCGCGSHQPRPTELRLHARRCREGRTRVSSRTLPGFLRLRMVRDPSIVSPFLTGVCVCVPWLVGVRTNTAQDRDERRIGMNGGAIYSREREREN